MTVDFQFARNTELNYHFPQPDSRDQLRAWSVGTISKTRSLAAKEE
jgi:hypothetical protein